MQIQKMSRIAYPVRNHELISPAKYRNENSSFNIFDIFALGVYVYTFKYLTSI